MTQLEGKTIEQVRPMTDGELEREFGERGFPHGRPAMLVLDDGTKLLPSMDPEGNGPGALFGRDADDVPFYVASERVDAK